MELKYLVKFIYRFGTSFLPDETKDKADSIVNTIRIIFFIFIIILLLFA